MATCWMVLIMGLKMFTRSSDVMSYDLSECSAVLMVLTFQNQAKSYSFQQGHDVHKAECIAC